MDFSEIVATEVVVATIISAMVVIILRVTPLFRGNGGDGGKRGAIDELIIQIARLRNELEASEREFRARLDEKDAEILILKVELAEARARLAAIDPQMSISMPASQENPLNVVKNALKNFFSPQNIAELAFELDLDSPNLYATDPDAARKLVEEAARASKTGLLIQLIKEKRPNVISLFEF